MTALRLADARALIGEQSDDAPDPGTGDGGAEQQLLGELARIGRTVIGLCIGYLSADDPASLDAETACYAQKVVVKAAGQLARVELMLGAPLSAAPEGG